MNSHMVLVGIEMKKKIKKANVAAGADSNHFLLSNGNSCVNPNNEVILANKSTFANWFDSSSCREPFV